MKRWSTERVEDLDSRLESILYYIYMLFFVAPAGIAVQSATFCPQCCKRQRVQRNGRGKGHKV